MVEAAVRRDADAIGIAEFSFDADNRLIGVLFTRTEGSETSVLQETRTFESGLLRKIDTTVAHNSVSTVLVNELFYNEGRLASYTSTDQSSDGSSGDNENYKVQYNLEGQVSTLTLEVDGSERERHDFTWRPDDQLQLISSTSSAGSATLEFSYNAKGQLQFTQKTLAGVGAEFNEFFADYNYTLHRKYDNRGRVASLDIDIHSDSVIDGTVVFEWEDGACVPFIDLDPEGLPGYVRNAGVPYEPGSGIVLSTYCSDK
ncbi:hypothetical protein [Allohahella sp. A8]|uniref:hypothetical protein n=1 Tax=Allohahella sp. A8 TaxID=3141461 RepID=UPI003A807405